MPHCVRAHEIDESKPKSTQCISALCCMQPGKNVVVVVFVVVFLYFSAEIDVVGVVGCAHATFMCVCR